MAATAARRAKAFKVEKDPPVLHAWGDGSVRVGGTRVRLETIITAYQLGDTPETIAANYGQLPVGVIHTVLAYYHQHREQVDEYLAAPPDPAVEAKIETDTAALRAIVAGRLAEQRAQRTD